MQRARQERNSLLTFGVPGEGEDNAQLARQLSKRRNFRWEEDSCISKMKSRRTNPLNSWAGRQYKGALCNGTTGDSRGQKERRGFIVGGSVSVWGMERSSGRLGRFECAASRGTGRTNHCTMCKQRCQAEEGAEQVERWVGEADKRCVVRQLTQVQQKRKRKIMLLEIAAAGGAIGQ